ncbi:MAG TPA: GerMN domain-containing protein [Bacillota bacterium]|nr:GerMN domain-containing protein [Bacillota bacterium]
MLKKLAVLISVFLVILLFLTGCGDKDMDVDPESTPGDTNEFDDELTRETVIYYADDAGYLVPVMRKIPWVEGIAKATIGLMIDTPDQQESLMIMGLRPLLPAEAKILGMSIIDGVARVDFNEAVLECKDAISENNMIQGLVMTLAGFSTVDKVQFLFDGEIIETMAHGTLVGTPISPIDINIEMSEDTTPEGAKVNVYFQSTSISQFDYLVPVTRITSSMNATLETAIEELLKGPKDEDNMTIDIPQDTKLLGIQMTDGITYINFSKEFNNLAADPKSEEMVLRALKLIASHYPEIQQLEILVDDKEYARAVHLDDLPVFANEY